MGTTEGLVFVTPTVAYGTGCPNAEHVHLRPKRGLEFLQKDGTKMVVVGTEAEAVELLEGLGLSETLIEDRIRFGQTGAINSES